MVRCAIPSIPVARSPGEDDEDCDNGRARKHPVLGVDAKNAKCLNEEVHGTRPFVGQATRFGNGNILFLYDGCSARRAQACQHSRTAQGMGQPWSERGSRGALDDQSVEEIFERDASGLVCSPVRAKPGFTKPDAHRPALAPDLPGPILTCIAGPGHDDVKGPSWRRAQHQVTGAMAGCASSRF